MQPPAQTLANHAFATPFPQEEAGVVEGGIPDDWLAAQAAEGSLKAMEALVIRHQPRIFRFLLAKTSTRTEAEDLTQETFLTACRKIRGYNPKFPFTTWLYTIAQRLAISAWRKKKETTDDIPELTDSAACPAENAQANEEKSNLWIHAHKILNHNQYSALWLHYAEDLPVADIAKALRKTVPGVKLLLFRARNKLQANLSPELL